MSRRGLLIVEVSMYLGSVDVSWLMADKIEIILNGELIAVSEGQTVGQLLVELGLRAEQVAVEFNGQIVNRKLWSEQSVKPGDRIEIVHFVGGGKEISSVG